jgi:2,5-diketo-D-gluconate reductase B
MLGFAVHGSGRTGGTQEQGLCGTTGDRFSGRALPSSDERPISVDPFRHRNVQVLGLSDGSAYSVGNAFGFETSSDAPDLFVSLGERTPIGPVYRALTTDSNVSSVKTVPITTVTPAGFATGRTTSISESYSLIFGATSIHINDIEVPNHSLTDGSAGTTGRYFPIAAVIPSVLDDSRYRIGLGTYSLTGEDAVETMATAIEAGYRHIDTARLYGNESEVGAAIDRASVDREDLFVATKIAHFEEPEPTPEYVRSGVEESREELGVDTIDLLYHHWPRRPEEIGTVLPVLEELVEAGAAERVGVSNYTIDDVRQARELVDVPLYANQVEMHPLLQQSELHEFLRGDAFLVAYSPLAQGAVFDVPELEEVAEKHGTSAAVVSLAWLLSKDGVVAIPRSSSAAHVHENLAARDLELDEEDVERIESIDDTVRCEDPEWMEW